MPPKALYNALLVVLVFGLCALAPSVAIAQSPPKGAWGFEDGTGTSAADASGNGNAATLLNGPSWTSGRIGGALSFDGLNDAVEVPDADSLDFTTAMTASAWIRLDTQPVWEPIVVKLMPSAFSYGLVFEPGYLKAYLRYGGADLFAISSNPLGVGADIRALDITGRVLWTESTSGEPLFGDVYGGLIALVSHDEYPGLHSGITRLAGAGGLPWTYEANGRLMSRPVQTPDGLIVFSVQPDDEGVSDTLYLVGIEGQSGAMRFRFRAPHSSITYAYTGNCVGWAEPGTISTSPKLGSMAVGEDGAVYFQLMKHEVDSALIDCSMYPTSPPVASYGIKQELSVARLSPAGALTLDSIWTDELTPTAQQELSLNQMFPGSVAPNGLGSVVASYEVHATRITWGQGVEFEGLSAFLWSEGATYAVAPRYAFANPPVNIQTSPLEHVGDDGTVYLRNATGVTAIDGANGTTKWTTPNTNLVVPELKSGATLQAPNGDVVSINGSGISTTLGSLPIQNPLQIRFGIWTGTANGELRAISADPVNEANFQFKAEQNVAPKARHFYTREEAALRVLDYTSFLTDITNWEWGGRICHKGNGFEWSRIVTSNDPGSVSIPFDLCQSNTWAAEYHTHTLPPGSHTPSGPDLNNANANPGIPSYLSAPELFVAGVPRRRQMLKWWNTGDRTAAQNICVQQAGSGWIPYPHVAGTGGARCDTPTP